MVLVRRLSLLKKLKCKLTIVKCRNAWMNSHQFAFFNCPFNFFNESHSVRALTTLPRFSSAQGEPLIRRRGPEIVPGDSFQSCLTRLSFVAMNFGANCSDGNHWMDRSPPMHVARRAKLGRVSGNAFEEAVEFAAWSHSSTKGDSRGCPCDHVAGYSPTRAGCSQEDGQQASREGEGDCIQTGRCTSGVRPDTGTRCESQTGRSGTRRLVDAVARRA